MEPKPWWGSKVNWLGIGLMLISVAEFVAKDELTPDWMDKWILLVAGAMAIVFRSVTDKPIANRVL